MSFPELDRSTSRPPDGYTIVPITPQQLSAPLRICVLVRREPEPAGGYLVVLRDRIEARALLGCISDAAGRVKQWIEIWVQDPEVLFSHMIGLNLARDALNNSVLDSRWRSYLEHCDADEEVTSRIKTGWEENGPGPIYIDVKSMQAVQPAFAATEHLPMLCRDDALLARHHLPLYSTTLHRYWFHTEPNDKYTFWPLSAGAPQNANTRDIKSLLPADSTLIPLNPSSGPIVIRTFNPFGLEELEQQLGGSAWAGIPHGNSRLRLGPVPTSAENAEKFGGWMFLERHGRAGRFVEVFHLKLRCLLDMFIAVRSLLQKTQRPMLNLRPESFQVACEGAGTALPVLWTCRPRLVDPGDSVRLSTASSAVPYFVPARNEGLSIFQPAKVREFSAGRGQFQIRRFSIGMDGSIGVEGTFHTREYVAGVKNDLIWFRLHLAGKRIDLYATLEARQNLADGELRFKATGLRLDDAMQAALKSAEGVFLSEVSFEVIPLLSSPCDLYSLGVLAVQMLLYRPDTTLAETIGNLMSLCRRLAQGYDAGTTRQLRIQAVFADERRFFETLGAQRLIFDQLSPETAAKMLPEELWWDTLAAIVPLFPGLGPDSSATDFADAPPGNIHRIFDAPIDAFTSLVTRSRSLLMVDWNYNREVHAVLQKLRST